MQNQIQQGGTRILMLIQHVTEYINLYNDGHKVRYRSLLLNLDTKA